MTRKKESEIRAMTKVKHNIEFCKCFAVVSATGDKGELFRVLTARQIAALIDSIYDRTVVTNWVIDSGDEYLNGLNPAYTKKVVYEDSGDGETHKEVAIENETEPSELLLKTPLSRHRSCMACTNTYVHANDLIRCLQYVRSPDMGGLFLCMGHALMWSSFSALSGIM